MSKECIEKTWTSKKTSLLHFQCPYYKETDWVPTSSANLQSYRPTFDAGLNQKTEQSTCSNLVSLSREQICTFVISAQNDFSSIVWQAPVYVKILIENSLFSNTMFVKQRNVQPSEAGNFHYWR